MKKLAGLAFFRGTLLILLSMLLLATSSVMAAEAPVKEATLEFNFRPVVTFRTLFVGATPEVRVERALLRLEKLTPGQMEQPVELTPFAVEGSKAMGVRIGDFVLFNMLEGDLDPDEKISLDEYARRTSIALAEALRSASEQRRPAIFFKGVLLSLVATALAFALLWGIRRASGILVGRLQVVIEREHVSAGWRWARHGWLLVQRVAQLLMAILWLSIADIWLTYVLSLFPLTEPLSERLGDFVWLCSRNLWSGSRSEPDAEDTGCHGAYAPTYPGGRNAQAEHEANRDPAAATVAKPVESCCCRDGRIGDSLGSDGSHRGSRFCRNAVSALPIRARASARSSEWFAALSLCRVSADVQCLERHATLRTA